MSKNPYSQEQKKFSIISPCYGWTFSCLEKNANTLNEQEYKTFEWIVVFDGKSYKGEQAMQRIKSKYPEMDVSWYTIDHAGAPAARNYGATKATGDYYLFLNADNYLYPEALRVFATSFEEHPEVNRVWGIYDIIRADGSTMGAIGMVPVFPDGKVWYKGFKYTNYCDSSFPIRKEAYIPWDETVQSLQDWDWNIRQLQRDNFEGKDWLFIHHNFFVAEDTRPGGLSDDSHQHWIERSDYVRNKNGLPKSDICVTSLGASHHGFHVAEKLGADYLPMPSYKPHKYKMIYLVGFFTQEDPKQPIVTKMHMDVFERAEKATKVIHWIGSDVLQLYWNCSFQKLKELRQWFKDQKVIQLCEVDYIQKELKEIGIEAQVVPIPPQRLYDPLPLPDKFTVGIYLPDRKLYNPDLMMEIVRSMPDVHFYLFGQSEQAGQRGENWEHLGYTDMETLIPKLSANLRITMHDGLPLTPLECLTACRNVIINHPLSGAIVVKKDRTAIVAGIRKAMKEPLDYKWSNYWHKELDYSTYNARIKELL